MRASWARAVALASAAGAVTAHLGVASPPTPAAAAAAVEPPNVVVIVLDDARAELPRTVSFDPIDVMTRTAQWMSAGTTYTQATVAIPSCCPSRAGAFTGRYPHNSGVRLQSQGPLHDRANTLASRLQDAGYYTAMAGKYLTTDGWDRRPAGFTDSTVIRGGYGVSSTVDDPEPGAYGRIVGTPAKVDGMSTTLPGYSTTALGARAEEYVRKGAATGRPWFVYLAPQAPHDSTRLGFDVQMPTPARRDDDTPIPRCADPAEADRSDKPKYVRNTDSSTAAGEVLCEETAQTLMEADRAIHRLLLTVQGTGELDNTMVVFTSDNGYLYGAHGNHKKFRPYEESLRVPLGLRWPAGDVPATRSNRLASLVDLLPTVQQAARISQPPGAPALDGESLLAPSRRTVQFSTYYRDRDNGRLPTWAAVRTPTYKFVRVWTTLSDGSLSLQAEEYYDLVTDPDESENVLRDAVTGNEPSATELRRLRGLVDRARTCSGSSCIR